MGRPKITDFETSVTNAKSELTEAFLTETFDALNQEVALDWITRHRLKAIWTALTKPISKKDTE